MLDLDAALRGGAIALLLLLAALALRRGGRSPDNVLRAAFALSAACYALISAPDLAARHDPWLVPPRLISMSTTVVFWLWSRSVFDDEFRPSWRHAAIWLGVVGLSLGCMLHPDARLFRLLNFVSLGFIGLGIWEALSGRATDLVEGRRRLRPFLALAAAACSAAIVVAELFWHDAVVAAPGSLINAGLMAGVTFAFALNALRGVSPLPDGEPASSPSPAPPPDSRDAPVLAALTRLMAEDKAYRESGLTVAALADRLGIPEYRLRRLINGQLGHRNFSSFVNGYRLKDAIAALADPGQAEVPVLTIALDAGFQSIGPFNRAFKAATGTTPTEYRRVRANGGTTGLAPEPRRI